MTLLAVLLVCQMPPGVKTLGEADKVRVGKKTGYQVGNNELAFVIRGPKKVVLKLHGHVKLHGRSIWVDIERDDAFVSENTLVLVDQQRGPKKLRAQVVLEMAVPSGEHTYRIRSSDPLVVLIGKPSRGGSRVVAAAETQLMGQTSADKGQESIKEGAEEAGERAGEQSSAQAHQGSSEGAGETPGEEADEALGVQAEQDSGDAAAAETSSAESGPSDQPDEANKELSAHGPFPDAQESALGQLGYADGFFLRSADDRFELRHKGGLQVRHTLTSVQETGSRRQTSAFSIPRAHIDLHGHAFAPLVRFRIEVDLGEGFARLKDCWADTVLVPEALLLRVGQLKRPFSRQHITSSGRLELVDRALTDGFFDAGRDIGLLLHNDYEQSPPFEWAVGFINGESTLPTISEEGISNIPSVAAYGIVTRLGYNYGGIRGYREPDLEGGALRFGLATSMFAKLDADNNDDSAISASVDGILKAYGFSTSGALYLKTTQSGEGMFEQNLTVLAFYLQVGFMLASILEPVLRYGMVAVAGKRNNHQEMTLGLSVYVFEHSLKVATDFSFLVPEGVALGDSVLRSRLQFQFAF